MKTKRLAPDGNRIRRVAPQKKLEEIRVIATARCLLLSVWKTSARGGHNH
jgi:hypothetical protein